MRFFEPRSLDDRSRVPATSRLSSATRSRERQSHRDRDQCRPHRSHRLVPNSTDTHTHTLVWIGVSLRPLATRVDQPARSSRRHGLMIVCVERCRQREQERESSFVCCLIPSRISQPINQSINQSTNQSINQSTNQSTNPPNCCVILVASYSI